MAQGIFINNKWFDHSTLINHHALENDELNTFEAETIKFYQDWHNGQDTFTQYTSGSTGEARPISISRQKMEISAQSTLSTLAIQPKQNALLCLSPQYIAGKMMMVRAFIGNLNLICVDPSTDPFKNIKANQKIQFTAVVPQQLQAIINKDDHYANVFDVSAKILVGGSKLNSQLEQQATHLPYSIFHTFGMTETVSHIALRKLTSNQDNDQYKVLNGVEIDTDSRSCLKIKGPVTDNKWLITNDFVEIIEKDSFLWKGRYDNIINSGGIKINPETVEKSLEKIIDDWGIANNFFITSLPDQSLGEKMVLIIESRDRHLDEHELLQKIKTLLPRYMSPKQIFLLPDFIFTPTNKIDRNKTKRLITK